MITFLLSFLFLLVGCIIGWIGHDKYLEYLHYNTHEFEKIIRENPHPELFDKNGKLNREEYTALTFDLDFDPEDFDPEDFSYIP